MNHIVLVGLNHRSAPIELRERLAFRKEQLPDAFARLRDELGLREAAILSTCNRVEIYAGVPDIDGAVDRLGRFLSDHGQVEMSGLSSRLYSYVEPHSIHHLFAVASGLDSMVLGEGEILYQVKHAYQSAKEHGATGKLFNALFQRAFNTAKTVRSHTAIGRGGTSIGTVAVELSEKIFGQLSGATVLLIGAGKLGEVTLKRLAVRGVRTIRIMNRSPERAEEIASTYGAVSVPVSQLSAQLLEADIAITCSGAPSYVLRRDRVAEAMRLRRQRPLCLVDLGVPRNIEPTVGTLENVYLFDVDDLQGLADRNHHARQQVVDASEAIIDQKVDRFLAWWQRERERAEHLAGVLS